MNAAAVANLITLAVNISSSGDNTIRAANAGKRFAVTDAFLQAEADVAITVKSGSTVITGAIDFTAATATERLWQATDGRPLWKTRAINEALILNLSGAVQVNGWINLLEVDQ